MGNGTSMIISNHDNYWKHDDDIYMYVGGKVNVKDKGQIRHVQVDESVTKIDDGTFSHCVNLSSITNLHKTMKEIGDGSFHGCATIQVVDLYNTSIEIIGICSFAFCTNMKQIILPPNNTIKEIKYGCFRNCNQLTFIDLEHTAIEKIDNHTFFSCISLKSIKFPTTLQCIGLGSFRGCTNLSSIDLRTTSVISIDNHAFDSCSALMYVNFPKTIKYIDGNSFCFCTSLRKIDMSETSIESIGNHAFMFCSKLETIIFSKSLKVIGQGTFRDCTSITSLDFREASLLEKIDHQAYYNCTNLSTINPSSDTTNFQVRNDETVPHSNMVVLSTTLVEIGDYIFNDCPKLIDTVLHTNSIHYECDINRGGRKFLQRHDNNNNNNHHHHHNGKAYPSSLWPHILYRIIHKLKLPKQRIRSNEKNLTVYTYAMPVRRFTIIYYFLIHGIVMDVQILENTKKGKDTQKSDMNKKDQQDNSQKQKQINYTPLLEHVPVSSFPFPGNIATSDM